MIFYPGQEELGVAPENVVGCDEDVGARVLGEEASLSRLPFRRQSDATRRDKDRSRDKPGKRAKW